MRTVAITVVLVTLGASCLDEPPCRRAMDNFYDVVANGYCVLVVRRAGEVQTEEIQTEDEAVQWCEESEVVAVECECEQEYNDMLACLETTKYPYCQDCDPALQALQTCYACLAQPVSLTIGPSAARLTAAR